MIKKHKKFIDIYEKEIKKHREKYYKNIIQYSNKKNNPPTVAFFLMPILLALVILVLTEFSIKGYFIAYISIFIANYTIKILKKYFKLEITNDYIEALKKHGYYSIEDYENKLKKYITGPEGYYNLLQKNLIEKYKIDQNTRRISTINGDEYYLWTNTNKDKIHLLNTKVVSKPKIKTIILSEIRYYRIDNIRRCIVVNTSKGDYYFKEENIKIISELMKEKRLENLKSFTPSIYIDDFEIFMHSIKTEEAKEQSENEKIVLSTMMSIIIFSVALFILVAVTVIIKKYSIIFNIINVLLVIIISYQLNKFLNIKKPKTKDDLEYIKELNSNPECIERFKELKFVLGISEQYDKIYSKEGAEYLTWTKNGYFHIFLNVIYFNIVYISIKLSDVSYYKVEKKTCEVKLKDKKLEFTNDAETIFKKILPNKDYYWLKGYQK